MDNIEEFLKTIKIAKENLDDRIDDDYQDSDLNLGNSVVLKKFESLYKQVVDIEDQLLSEEIRTKLNKQFDDIRQLFAANFVMSL